MALSLPWVIYRGACKVEFGQEQVLNIYICPVCLVGAVGLCSWAGTICAWIKVSNKSHIDFSYVGCNCKMPSNRDCM